MGLEAGTFVDDLVVTNPDGATDSKSQGDNHLRLIKTVLKNTFPGLAGSAFRIQVKSTGYTVVASDNMSVIVCTSSLTLSLTAAATLGNKQMTVIICKAASVLLDPAGVDTVNGDASMLLTFNEAAILFCDGVSDFPVMKLGGVGGSAVTGDVKAAMRATPEAGWIVARGTIGDATSGASTLAHASAEALFKLLHTDFADAQAPVLPGGRGASAEDDWTGHKTIGVPDCSGRSIIGKESSESRITTAISGFSGATLGAAGGAQSHTLNLNEIPAHDHNFPGTDVYITGNNGDFLFVTVDGGVSEPLFSRQAASSNGGGGAHRNVHPGIVLNYFVKL